jgi:hypothetical protein
VRGRRFLVEHVGDAVSKRSSAGRGPGCRALEGTRSLAGQAKAAPRPPLPGRPKAHSFQLVAGAI